MTLITDRKSSDFYSMKTVLDSASMRFFAGFTEASIEAARVRPGERVSRDLPANTSGCTLIRPGGRACYPAVWIQDFAIALETGFVSPHPPAACGVRGVDFRAQGHAQRAVLYAHFGGLSPLC